MKKILYSIISVLLLGSCASKNQKEALDEVARVYSAKTDFSKGFNKNAGQPAVNYFKIKVSGSPIIDSMEANKAAANIALMLYDKFTEAERKDYTYIEVEIVKNDPAQKGANRIFPIGDLAAPDQQVGLFKSFSNDILNQDYNAAASLIDSPYRKPASAGQIKDYITKFVKKEGKINTYKRTGFTLGTTDDGKRYYIFSGFFIFENNKHLNYYVETYDDVHNRYLFDFHID